MLKELIAKNRSYRRFYQDKQVSWDVLKELVDLARLSPCGANRQTLRFVLSADEKKNAAISKCIFWAGYYKDWDGPEDGEKPSAYIVIVRDISAGGGMPQDEGIAAQSILLGAVEKGMGGCIIANINRKELKKVLAIGDKYEIALVLAIGYPKEKVVLEALGQSGDIKYWRDEKQVHHVPKRSLQDLILE